MAMSLAVKYRPSTLRELVSQTSIVETLERQVDENKFSNCYLFTGPSGCGKTTIARALATAINKEFRDNKPIEIDGASNNGVDNVRTIIEDAYHKSITGGYKIFIVDEVHMLSTAAWNSFLKTLEEPPSCTIFMFCTTDPQKIPNTILNRVVRYNLAKIPTNLIKDRLAYICANEGFTNYAEAIDYISKIANGGMRDAISMLEKVSLLSNDITMENALKVLGNFSYETNFKLTNAIIDGNINDAIMIVEDFYNSGSDLKLFVDTYLEFILDIFKYVTFGTLSITKIPQIYEESVKYACGIENPKTYYANFIEKLFELKTLVKYDTNIKTTIEVKFSAFCRGL